MFKKIIFFLSDSFLAKINYKALSIVSEHVTKVQMSLIDNNIKRTKFNLNEKPQIPIYIVV